MKVETDKVTGKVVLVPEGAAESSRAVSLQPVPKELAPLEVVKADD